MSDQARDARGRWAGGSEGAARNSGSYPVTPHDGQHSVGTHVSATNKGVTNTVRERQALFARQDWHAQNAPRSIYKGK